MLRTALQRSGTALLFSGGGRAIAGEVSGKISRILFFFSAPRCAPLRSFSLALHRRVRVLSDGGGGGGGRGVFRRERRGGNSMGALFFSVFFSVDRVVVALSSLFLLSFSLDPLSLSLLFPRPSLINKNSLPFIQALPAAAAALASTTDGANRGFAAVANGGSSSSSRKLAFGAAAATAGALAFAAAPLAFAEEEADHGE